MKKSKTSRPRKVLPVPFAVQQMAGRFQSIEKDQIDHAYQEAVRLLSHDHMHEPDQDVNFYIQETSERRLDADDPDVRNEHYRSHCGTILGAIQEPAFCLGFSLAYLLFTQKDGVR